jgi:hypothetical protein
MIFYLNSLSNILIYLFIMAGKCPNLEKCSLLPLLKMEATKKSIIALYCEGSFQNCQRKKMNDAGRPVPEKLLPSGKFLQN